MRTTLDLPESLLKNVQIIFPAKTKRGAIVMALENALQSVAYKRLSEAGGKFPRLKKLINLDVLRDRNHYKKFAKWKKKAS